MELKHSSCRPRMSAASAGAQLIVTPPTKINKIYIRSSIRTLAIFCRTECIDACIVYILNLFPGDDLKNTK